MKAMEQLFLGPIFFRELQDDVFVKLEAGGMSPRISLQEVAAASGRPRGCVYFR